MTEIAKFFAKKITPHFDTVSCADLNFLSSLLKILSTRISWPYGFLKNLAPAAGLSLRNVPFLMEGSSITLPRLGGAS